MDLNTMETSEIGERENRLEILNFKWLYIVQSIEGLICHRLGFLFPSQIPRPDSCTRLLQPSQLPQLPKASGQQSGKWVGEPDLCRVWLPDYCSRLSIIAPLCSSSLIARLGLQVRSDKILAQIQSCWRRQGALSSKSLQLLFPQISCCTNTKPTYTKIIFNVIW